MKKEFVYNFECEMCKNVVVIEGTAEQWTAFHYKTKNIQDIFPELSADDREIMLTGLCYKCYDVIFYRR